MIFDPILLQKYRLMYLKLRAITGPSRYYMLNIIKNNPEINVTSLVEITNMEQSIVSQHLAVLKKASLVYSVAHMKERKYAIHVEELDSLIQFCYQIRHGKGKTDLALNSAYSTLLEGYKYLKFLLQPGRLVLMEILDRTQGSSVNELSELTKQTQSIASQNLKILTELHLVKKKTQGRKSLFYINKERIEFLNRIF